MMTVENGAAPGGEEHVDAPEQTEGEVWGDDRPARRPERDERGRFMRRAEEEPSDEDGAAPEVTKPEPEQPAQQQPPAQQAAAAPPAQQQPQQPQQPDIDAIVAAALAKAGVKPAAQQQAQEPAPEPDIRTDPEGWKNWFTHRQAMQDWERRSAWSQTRARKEFADYEEVEKFVLDAADADQTGRLWQQIFAAEAPAYEVYELGKKLKLQNQIQEIGGDPDGWAEKRILDRMRSDEAFRQKVLTEFQPQPSATAKPNLPPSFATARSTAGRSEPAPTAPSEEQVWGGGRLSRGARH